MPENPQPTERLSRRAALKVMAQSASLAATASLPILNPAPLRAGTHCSWASDATSRGAARAAAPRFFDAEQIRALDALSEAILPTDEHSPGAKAAGVSAYIDTVVAESDERVRNAWIQGLAAINKRAMTDWGKIYAEGSPEQQEALLRELSENEQHPRTVEEEFFVAVKRATVQGYYTSEIGIHNELEYQGNTALAEFEGCQHPGHTNPQALREGRDLAVTRSRGTVGPLNHRDDQER